MGLTKVTYSMIEGAVYNVLDYGADPTGVSDSRAAIQAAVDAAYAAGGGTVYLPDGTFLIDSYAEALGYYTVKAKSNVSFFGNGPSSIIKIANGLMGTRGISFLYDHENAVNNVRYSNFTINWNGENNPNQNTPGSNVTRLGTGNGATNWHIDNVTFLNPPGHHNIWISGTSVVSGGNGDGNSITNCTFRNAGKAVAGNTLITDHSSIYCGVGNTVISNNVFWCDNLNDTVATAIEVHGFNNVCFGNVIYGYSKGINLGAAEGYNEYNLSATANNMFNVITGIWLWDANTNQNNYFDVSDNSIVLRSVAGENSHGIYTASSSSSINGKLTVSNNEITLLNCADFDEAWVGIYVVDWANFYCTDNQLYNFNGEGIYYNVNATHADTIVIENNTIENCGYTTASGRKQSIRLDTSSSYANRVFINDNYLITSAPFGSGTVAQYGIRVGGVVNLLKITSNETQYQSVASIYRPDAVLAGPTYIEHSGDENPYNLINATYGSIYRSTTTTTVWNALRPVDGSTDYNGTNQIWIATSYGTAAPTTGYHAFGDRVISSTPAVGQPKSWVCTAAGTPGTWVSEGNL